MVFEEIFGGNWILLEVDGVVHGALEGTSTLSGARKTEWDDVVFRQT